MKCLDTTDIIKRGYEEEICVELLEHFKCKETHTSVIETAFILI